MNVLLAAVGGIKISAIAAAKAVNMTRLSIGAASYFFAKKTSKKIARPNTWFF